MTLYYNCDDSLTVLETRLLRPSKIHTGVSFSEWSELGSHGPFKIAFRRDAPWVGECVQVQYWQFPDMAMRRAGQPKPPDPDHYAEHCHTGERVDDVEYARRRDAMERALGGRMPVHRVWKTELFADEREWYAPGPIRFEDGDVASVTFMTNAPSIYPRKTQQARRLLRTNPGYEERAVDDPYLRKVG